MQRQPTSSPSPNPVSPPVHQDSSLVTWQWGIPLLLSPSEQKTLAPDQPQVPASPKPPTSPASGGARRWEIQYGEIKLEQKLGHGAFGEVFSGSYRKSKVAVKQYGFRGKLLSEQEEMLLQEADVMEGLRSEYLVGFRGICLDPLYCLVMEFCEGGTLRARLDKTSEAITPLMQLRWAMQISYGVYQLHSVKIVHRDLKGENILLDRQGHAKVADFGLSIVKSSSASHSKTSARGGAGTIPWMAPELHDGQSNSQATDVYSLGVTLWEMVSRKMPYVGLTMGQMISRTVQGKRDPLPNPCPEVFRLMITACYHMEAKERPTAEQVGEQFEAALTNVESVPLSASTLLTKESHELQTQKLKEMEQKMAQMQLAHKRQLVEEKQRLAAEKQAEIERIKQQHQAELKRSQADSKLKPPSQTIATPSKTAPIPAIPLTSQSRQTLMPTPKTEPMKVSKEQLKLQDELVKACEQGDLKAAQALFKTTLFRKITAKPDVPNAAGKQPLGAAVWGMNPDVVNELLKQAGGVAPMTWEECEKHNLKYYKEVFIVPEFDPQKYGEWYQLLQKMAPNPFIRAFHLKKIDERWHDNNSSSWESLNRYVERWLLLEDYDLCCRIRRDCEEPVAVTEAGYIGFRTQIKQGVETAKHLTVEMTW